MSNLRPLYFGQQPPAQWCFTQIDNPGTEGPFPGAQHPILGHGTLLAESSIQNSAGDPVPGGFLFNNTVVFTISFFSATCYFKIYWDVYKAKQVDGNPVNYTYDHTDSYQYEPSANSQGFCLPEDFNLSNAGSSENGFYTPGITGWNTTPTQTYTPDAPDTPPADPSVGHACTTYITLLNFRYSCVRGYVPPVDGSANGFPSNAPATNPNASQSGDTGDSGDDAADDGTGTGDSGDSGDNGDSWGLGDSGGLGDDGGLTTGSLTTGSLGNDGGLTSSGLTTGSLTTSGLTSSGLTTSGLSSSGLSTGSLGDSGGLSTPGVQSDGSLSVGSLTTGSLTAGSTTPPTGGL